MTDKPASLNAAPAAATRPQRVLVVCAANVCRSPSMEFLLQHHLVKAAPETIWVVESAGTTAILGDGMCPRSAEYVRRIPGGDDFGARHRSRLLTCAAVERADLVLVASEAERAAVAALDPGARRRTFTLQQAALLMRRVELVDGPGAAAVDDRSGPLMTVVDLLHKQRGTLSISAGPAHLSSRRWRRVPLTDIVDVHQGRERHRPMLKSISSASRTLAEGVALVGPGPGSPVVAQAAAIRAAAPRGDAASDR